METSMRLSAIGRTGVSLAVLGLIAFFWAQHGLTECQTATGQVGQGISDQLEQECQNRSIIRSVGGIMAAIGAGGIVIDVFGGSSRGERAAAGTGSARTRSSFVIPAGEFDYVEMGTTSEAKLEYSLEVIDGSGINAIVTYEKHLDEFRESPSIGWVEKASAVNVKEMKKQAILTPGDYVIILDNTGRLGGQKGREDVDVSIEYSLE